MYLMPPQTSMKKKTKAATTRARIMKAEIIVATVMSFNPENCPPGVMFIAWA